MPSEPRGFVISQADRRPMYLQIIEQIKRRIAVGDWAAGQPISIDPAARRRSSSQRHHRQARLSRARARGRHRNAPRQRLVCRCRHWTGRTPARGRSGQAPGRSRAPRRSPRDSPEGTPDAPARRGRSQRPPFLRTRSDRERPRRTDARRGEGLPVLLAAGHRPRHPHRTHRGLHRAERRRQVHDDSHPDGTRAPGPGRRARARTRDAIRPGSRQVGGGLCL